MGIDVAQFSRPGFFVNGDNFISGADDCHSGPYSCYYFLLPETGQKADLLWTDSLSCLQYLLPGFKVIAWANKVL